MQLCIANNAAPQGVTVKYRFDNNAANPPAHFWSPYPTVNPVKVTCLCEKCRP